MTDEQARLRQRIDILERIVVELHWMARRYADGRQSYVSKDFNDYTRELLVLGLKLNPGHEGTIWARDRDGPGASGLTQEEFDLGEPMPKWINNRELMITAMREIADAKVEFPIAYARDLMNQLEGVDGKA